MRAIQYSYLKGYTRMLAGGEVAREDCSAARETATQRQDDQSEDPRRL